MKFIRIDMKGHWRGEKHKSSVMGLGLYADVEDVSWEEGISCYRIDDISHALENLRYYWQEVAMLDAEDFKNMQITIFEGKLLPVWGSDGEDLATCEKTLFELDAYPIMKKLYEAYDRYRWEGEITEEEYLEELKRLIVV